MGSNTVLNRCKSSEAVQSAGRSYKDRMARRMGLIYGAEAEPAVRALVSLAVARLRDDTAAMVRADDAHLLEVAGNAQVIEERDRRCDAVRTLLVDLRETCEVVYGSDFVRELGFKGPTPTDPAAVHSLGAAVLEHLRSAEPARPTRPGLSMDLTVWTSPLADGLGDLGPALRAVPDDRDESGQALVAKHNAVERYDRTFCATADLLSHLLRAAGEGDLAKQIRPSTRKPGQTIEHASRYETA